MKRKKQQKQNKRKKETREEEAKEEVSGRGTPHTCHRRLYRGAGATAGGRPRPGTDRAVTHSNQ